MAGLFTVGSVSILSNSEPPGGLPKAYIDFSVRAAKSMTS